MNRSFLGGLVLTLAFGAQLASATSDSTKTFIANVFGPGNLGPELPGGLREIIDISQFEKSLPRGLSKSENCDEDAGMGWVEVAPSEVQGYGYQPQTGVIRNFDYAYCEPAFSANVAIIRPANSSKWYLIPSFMDKVYSAHTFGQMGTGSTEIVITGASYWSGSGRSPEVTVITLKDEKSPRGVTAIEMKTLEVSTFFN